MSTLTLPRLVGNAMAALQLADELGEVAGTNAVVSLRETEWVSDTATRALLHALLVARGAESLTFTHTPLRVELTLLDEAMEHNVLERLTVRTGQ